MNDGCVNKYSSIVDRCDAKYEHECKCKKEDSK